MDHNTYAQLHKTLVGRALELSLNKSNDYADQDVLSNFKRLSKAAEALNLQINTPYGYAMFMALMKLDRINNLIRLHKDPNNESTEDSFIDLINYVILAYANLVDGE